MRTEGFFHRWSRLKAESETETIPAASPERGAVLPAAAAAPGPGTAAPTTSAADPSPAGALRLPTLQDVALLNADSDYSAFVAQGVDKAVRRSAMKKLFADPHFNLIDGLDIYMGDYNKPDPVSAAMLGALQHAHSFFAQAAALEPPETEAEAEAGPAAAGGARLAGGEPPGPVLPDAANAPGEPTAHGEDAA